MSSITVGSLQRMSAGSLSALILAEENPANPTWAVVDVRDDDHIGGHIKGSRNVPSRTLDAMMPTLVRQLQDKATVVFHCALSQQRGPGAALKYMRERERMFPAGVKQTLAAEESESAQKDKIVEQQTVYVLDRGFVGWQEVYGEDERLTENYRKELWQDEFFD